MRLVLTLAILAAAPAAAATVAVDSFRDPATGFRVEISYSGSDMILDGINPQSHERLHLVVTPSRHVTGVFRGERVDYVAGEPSTAPALVAAN